MIIKSKKIIDGVYSLYFKNYNLNNLKIVKSMINENKISDVNRNILKLYLSEIVSNLNLKLINFDVWNDNLQNQDVMDIFRWHFEDPTGRIEAQLLIYFTDETLTEKTGGRIGFKYNNIEKWYNIKSGRCFLVKQDKDHLHKVEAAKLIFKDRICISVSLLGWKDLVING